MPVRVFGVAAAVLVVYFLFFFALTDVGLLGPDEPRYASIGREMAASGDWVTPRLWGEPWFEKPVLLYWMTAAGFRLGLNEDLAPRLPVAFTSLAFLVFFWVWLSREFGRRAASYATAILATTAGWIAFSQVGVTDLPMTACFAAAMLVCFRWIAHGDRRVLVPAGVLLGLAVLAKGLVPVALAAPLVWFGRKRLSGMVVVGAVAVVTAAPWYVLCTLRNGTAFLDEFFWKHHFERLASDSIQHVQPFWFYVPVLLAGLAPWTPAIVRLCRRELYDDQRVRFLLSLVLFGFLFFSIATNKLPGYLLPLLPPLSALLGVGLARGGDSRWPLALSAMLVVLFPLSAALLPVAVRSGLSRAGWPEIPWPAVMGCVALAVLVWWLARVGRRDGAVTAILLASVAGVVHVKITALPVMDRTVSTRSLWREIEPRRAEVCLDQIHRAWLYGLHYYAVTPLPRCSEANRELPVRQAPGEPARLSREPQD